MTYSRYAPRRVRCREFGICLEDLSFALGKPPLAAKFAWSLST